MSKKTGFIIIFFILIAIAWVYFIGPKLTKSENNFRGGGHGGRGHGHGGWRGGWRGGWGGWGYPYLYTDYPRCPYGYFWRDETMSCERI